MIDKERAVYLYKKFRHNRRGIRKEPDMASVCLICESRDIVQKQNEPHILYCRNCGFEFQRYECWHCGATVDSRDPDNGHCNICGWRKCTCGACHDRGCSNSSISPEAPTAHPE